MTLIELSNIFNTIVQNIPGLNNYHFGFLSDINTTIINNSNRSDKCQEKYPIVVFEPPTGSYKADDGKLFRTVKLLFADRQDSDKNGTTCETLVEKMSFLEGFALSFMRTLQTLKTTEPCLQKSLRKQEAGFSLDAYQFHDRLVTYEVTFSLVTPYNTECVNLDLDMINQEDDENVRCQAPEPPFVDEFSMLFDGVDEYQEVANPVGLSFGDGVTDTGLTISAWLKPINTGGDQWIINRRGGAVFPNKEEYQLGFLADGRMFLTIYSNGQSSNRITAITTTSINYGTYNHLLATYSGSGTFAGVAIYLDGVAQPLTNSSAGVFVAMNAFNRPLILGKIGFVDSSYFAGNMDEVSMFNIGFSQSDVNEIYNNGLPNDLLQITKAPNLVYWNRQGENAAFDQGLVSWILPDASMMNNTTRSVNMEESDRVTDVPT
jgi:hypothetical protein